MVRALSAQDHSGSTAKLLRVTTSFEPPALRVEPATAAHLRALLAGPDEFTQASGLAVVDGYVEFDGAIERSLQWVDDGLDPRWGSHLFIHVPDAALIGLGGFKGAPIDGTVEIGYGIAPTYRRQGHATAAAQALVALAYERGVRRVLAHTLGELNTSNRILAKLGFEHVADIEDDDAGTVWRWELLGR